MKASAAWVLVMVGMPSLAMADACVAIDPSAASAMLEKDARTTTESDDLRQERLIRLVYSKDGKTIIGSRQTLIQWRKDSWWRQLFSGRWPVQVEKSSFALCDLDGAQEALTTVEGDVVTEPDGVGPAVEKLRDDAVKGTKPSWPMPGASPAPAANAPPLAQGGPSSGGGREGGPSSVRGGAGVTFIEVQRPVRGGGGCPSVPGRITVCATRLAPEQQQ